MSATPVVGFSRLERAFTFASYITLGFASACLAWSEWDIVPDVRYLAGAVIPLLLLAYFLEGRWALSTRAANVLGLAITVVAGLRAAQLLLSPTPEGALASMPWPTSLVPMLGPLMLVLMLAKLLRPKTVGDHWGLQLIGLVCVGLGCTFADDGVFAALFAVYLLSALWCLGLFFLFRERLSARAAEMAHTPRPRQVLAWAIPILALAMFGFFTLPRSSAVWQVPRQAKRLDTGAAEDVGLDLNRTGTLTLDPDVAFEVFVEDAQGRPKLDLSTDQRWRGPVYHHYHNGGWRRTVPNSAASVRQAFVTEVMTSNPQAPSGALPDFGRADQYYLTYTLRARIGSIPFLADPVYRPPTIGVPVVTLGSAGRQIPWVSEFDGVLRPVGSPLVVGRSRFRQVTVPAPASGLSHEVPEQRIRSGRDIPPPDLPQLAEWTRNLLERLADNGRLPREVLTERDVFDHIRPRYHETVARVLEQHLAASGEYSYSLTLEHSGASDQNDPNKLLDPTIDFLFNTRSGHCNRFASALALMLRVLWIPCQVVTGFRGADSRGDGWYDVRQCYAHTWVEVQVQREGVRPAHDQFAGVKTWHWVTLDPTPAEAGAQAAAVGNRWWNTGFDVRRLYRDLILNFSAENRDNFLRDLVVTARQMWSGFFSELTARTAEGFHTRVIATLFVAIATVILILAVRWIRRRLPRWGWSRPTYPGTGFYQTLLGILAKRGWRPAPSQTPREFAAWVAGQLRLRRGGEDLAKDVGSTAELYYRVRFGAEPLNATEAQDVNGNLKRLAAALAIRGD